MYENSTTAGGYDEFHSLLQSKAHTAVQEGMGAWFLAKRGVDWESFVSWVQSKWKRKSCWVGFSQSMWNFNTI